MLQHLKPSTMNIWQIQYHCASLSPSQFVMFVMYRDCLPQLTIYLLLLLLFFIFLFLFLSITRERLKNTDIRNPEPWPLTLSAWHLTHDSGWTGGYWQHEHTHGKVIMCTACMHTLLPYWNFPTPEKLEWIKVMIRITAITFLIQN